jgi:hypothetical protein
MKKDAALFAILLLVTELGYAGDINLVEKIYYTGTIGPSEISMILEKINTNVRGQYKDLKNNDTTIHVSGTSDKHTLNLKEIRNGVVTAKINAQKNHNGQFEGVWEGTNKHQLRITPSSMSYKQLIEKISSNETSLIIKPKSGPDQIIPIEALADTLSVTFEDFTFDGYTDMRVLELEAGGNESYIYFEYNPKTRTFSKASPEISNLTNPLVIHGKKLVAGLNKDGCCNYLATLIDANNIYQAEYDYLSESGKERITGRVSRSVAETSISKEEFEQNYLAPIQKGSLQ